MAALITEFLSFNGQDYQLQDSQALHDLVDGGDFSETESVTIQIRRGLSTAMPALGVGEFGYQTDTKKLFIGTAEGNAEVIMGAAQASDSKKLNGKEASFYATASALQGVQNAAMPKSGGAFTGAVTTVNTLASNSRLMNSVVQDVNGSPVNSSYLVFRRKS